ncbi:MAG: hypothetical protein IJU95_09525, partial [Treponema sp.]|nr:hypothetical protein [Treponema sp.]
MASLIKARKILEDRPLRSFSVARCYLTLFVLPPSAWAAWSFIWTVATKFFIPQYLEKIHILRVPVKHVDHELDGKIPFRPELLPVYMRFINFWVDTISMLQVKFGIWNGAALGARLLRRLRTAYSSAYDIYSFCMTTTERPATDDKGIRALRRADPHYFCVPSLHIAIIVLTYSFYKKLFTEEDFTEDEKQAWLSELKEEGLAIGRSVLYLKQHSVNCLPAALYMMCRIAPDIVTADIAGFCIGSLMDGVEDIAPEDKEAIMAHILSMFESLMKAGEGTGDWTLPLKHWIDG